MSHFSGRWMHGSWFQHWFEGDGVGAPPRLKIIEARFVLRAHGTVTPQFELQVVTSTGDVYTLEL